LGGKGLSPETSAGLELLFYCPQSSKQEGKHSSAMNESSIHGERGTALSLAKIGVTENSFFFPSKQGAAIFSEVRSGPLGGSPQDLQRRSLTPSSTKAATRSCAKGRNRKGSLRLSKKGKSGLRFSLGGFLGEGEPHYLLGFRTVVHSFPSASQEKGGGRLVSGI